MNNFFISFFKKKKISEKYNNQNYEKIFKKPFFHLYDEIKKNKKILLTREMDNFKTTKSNLLCKFRRFKLSINK